MDATHGRGMKTSMSNMRGASLAERLDHHSIPEPNSGCLLWTGCSWLGYGRLFFNGRPRRAHRLSWELARGPIPDGLDVLHKRDNPGCIEPTHLFLGTDADNSADMRRKGRGKIPYVRGVQHAAAKLTEDQVRAIRIDHRSSRKAAAAYGVSQMVIVRIRNRKRWAHVS